MLTSLEVKISTWVFLGRMHIQIIARFDVMDEEPQLQISLLMTFSWSLEGRDGVVIWQGMEWVCKAQETAKERNLRKDPVQGKLRWPSVTGAQWERVGQRGCWGLTSWKVIILFYDKPFRDDCWVVSETS